LSRSLYIRLYPPASFPFQESEVPGDTQSAWYHTGATCPPDKTLVLKHPDHRNRRVLPVFGRDGTPVNPFGGGPRQFFDVFASLCFEYYRFVKNKPQEYFLSLPGLPFVPPYRKAIIYKGKIFSW
jgi:hypothetical protein